jgi:hypothetical protein
MTKFTGKFMYRGPVDEDGQQTWLCQGQDIPDGWERRSDSTLPHKWYTGNTKLNARWYQVRPVELPDPKWMGRIAPIGEAGGYTTLGEMRNRSDLDEWQFYNPAGTWSLMRHHVGLSRDFNNDNFPLLVRRKAQ